MCFHRMEAQQQLVADETTLTNTVTKELEYGVIPQFLGHEEAAIKKMLLKEKLKYNPKLQGIMLRFDDMEFVEKSGKIIDDCPLMYWKIRAKFSVFNVKVNQLVRCQINTLDDQYVNCVLVNCVNAAVQLDDNITDEEREKCSGLKARDDVVFRVKSFSPASLSIIGVIDSESIQQMSLLYSK